MQKHSQEAPTDAVPGNLVDRIAPTLTQPYLRLARYDRPIGAWLLFWPCAWALTLAMTSSEVGVGHVGLLLLLGVGAILMRGAGCCWNDIIDQDIDREVHRSQARPLASGVLSRRDAVVFLLLQLAAAFLILLQFNSFTILLCLAAMPLVFFYPFAKRVTSLPQLFLGLTFAWGALAGWSAVNASLALPAVILYVGCVAWIIGYDTIYAHQDSDDDALLGLGSSALFWGEGSRTAVAVCYSVAFLALMLAAWLSASGWLFYLCAPFIAAHFIWQVERLDVGDSDLCLRLFRSNRELGGLVFLALLLGAWSAV